MGLAVFEFDQAKINNIKQQWAAVMDCILWADVSSKKIGALPRARKRVLEVGESYRSFISSKEWIEQPRQQLKSALGSSVKLRDSLSALLLVNKHITEGEDIDLYKHLMTEFETDLMDFLLHYENHWAQTLENLPETEED